MNAYQQLIHDRLAEFGWVFGGYADLDAWWADQSWRLRSVWSPQECEAYLTFLVDPQADLNRRKSGEDVWAVKASSQPPSDGSARTQDGDVIFDFGHGWRARMGELFASLQNMRDQYVAGNVIVS
jgi:1,2-phenylacetyl-CoA epoxidase PaaB subunit